jgi:ABC-type branched-subunit amino acid transport system substrate-binding protein
MKRMGLFCAVMFVLSAAVYAQTYTDAEARRVLSNAGIGVNNPAPRTSLEGIRKSTIEAIITLKRASGADIVITGGTESDHASGTYSHANGYKVDLRLNSTLNNYIETHFAKAGTVGGYPAYKASSGNLYVKEGDHWDVTVY